MNKKAVNFACVLIRAFGFNSRGATSLIINMAASIKPPSPVAGKFLTVILLALTIWPLPGFAAEIRQEDLDSSLMAAAARGRLQTFNMLLSLGANIHAVDRKGNNAVLLATEGEQHDMLRMLLGKGVNANARGGSGFTPLTYGALHGLRREIRLLLKAGADPDLHNILGSAPLHIAIEHGNDVVVADLIAAGASLEDRNAAGETPLIVAVRTDNRKVFDTLLAAGARASVQDKTGRSALFQAIWEKREYMALSLIDKGAGFKLQSDGLTPLRLARLMDQPVIVAALKGKGATE